MAIVGVASVFPSGSGAVGTARLKCRRFRTYRVGSFHGVSYYFITIIFLFHPFLISINKSSLLVFPFACLKGCWRILWLLPRAVPWPWTQHWSDRYNIPFYWNSVTGESVWEVWSQHWSDQYNIPFYWNNLTTESVWELPPATIISLAGH